jgi:hypothetical protein
MEQNVQTHRWAHWKRLMTVCQFPGHDTILRLCKMLLLWETWGRVCKLYYFYNCMWIYTCLNINIFIRHSCWPPVAYTCNPSYLEGLDGENCGSKSDQTNSLRDPHLQSSHSQMDWRCGLRGGAPALLVQGPEFKPQSHRKKKEEKTLLWKWKGKKIWE